MEYHELANMFPMVEANIKAIAASIKEGGYNEETPIVLYQGKILDGRHRWEACKLTNTQPTIIYFTGADPLKYVIDKNLNRYHLNESQRAVVAAKLANMQHGGDRRSDQAANLPVENLETFPQVSQAQAAEMLNVSDRSIRTIKDIERKAPELIEKIERGEMTANQANKEVKRIEKYNQPSPVLPNNKYRVFYADPPWKYTSGDQHTREEQETTLIDHYPSMTIQELCELPIAEMSEDNAVLFLWTTSPLLEECFQVINAWGFKYKTSIVWNKEAHNVGHYVSVRHEFLLICTKGSCKPDIDKLLPSVVSEKRTEHSVKPETFRNMIDTMYPFGKRIELFARRSVDNWEVWGNESGIQ